MTTPAITHSKAALVAAVQDEMDALYQRRLQALGVETFLLDLSDARSERLSTELSTASHKLEECRSRFECLDRQLAQLEALFND